MKVGQLFLPDSFAYSEQRKIQSLPVPIAPAAATATTQYMLYEAPITSLWFIGFISSADPIRGGFGATIMDLSGVLEETDFQDGGLILAGTFWLHAPQMFEKLVENAAQELQPLLAQKASFGEKAGVWANQPEVYETFIDRRKNPGEINRQNSYIILLWEDWERRKVPLKDRVAQMAKEGFGELTPTNIQKRADRLELSANNGGRPHQCVGIDFPVSRKVGHQIFSPAEFERFLADKAE